MRFAFLAAALIPAACSHSLDADRENLRAEITDLERRLPPESPLWIADGPDRFDAFVPDGGPEIPDFLHRHLLTKLSAMSDAEVDRLSAGDFDYDACRQDPALYRGKIWRVHGVIAELHAEPLLLKAGTPGTYHAGVFFDKETRPCVFHVAQKPAVLTIPQDAVETRAIFVKWIDYASRSGRRVTAPFFIGRTLRRYL